ncbi:hypothetical protein MKW94_001494 [Papaver nudicaule]|uniref:RBR-type E3 ubiquitin transferase n=1 Tax=Papaver nudicaule TaxID=74823 RepID=A0AA42B080_PAPNU|nr:hypothetical protein [Papaver nudicaule]
MANIQPTLENPSSNTLVDNEINLDATSSSKEDSGSFTCEICVELVPSNAKFENMEVMNGCSHNYCKCCIAKYIQVKVIQDNTSQINCPDTNCSAVLDTLSCRSIVSEEVFEKWCRAHCESAVLLQSSKGGFAYGRSYCPHRDCSELVLNECVDTTNSATKVTKSNCPNCKKLFCFHCMVPWKENHQCIGRSETIVDINDVLFIKNVKHNKWVRCPSCSHYVERSQGCRFIRCRCKTEFCYDCGEQACICKGKLSHWQMITLGIVLLPVMVPIAVFCLIFKGIKKSLTTHPWLFCLVFFSLIILIIWIFRL